MSASSQTTETFLSLQRPPCLLLEQRVLIGPQDPVSESWLVEEVHFCFHERSDVDIEDISATDMC